MIYLAMIIIYFKVLHPQLSPGLLDTSSTIFKYFIHEIRYTKQNKIKKGMACSCIVHDIENVSLSSTIQKDG
jgi:hypothetical protein